MPKLFLAATLVFGLAGCAAPMFAKLTSRVVGVDPTAAGTAPAEADKNAETIAVTLPAFGEAQPFSKIDTDGPVTVWQSPGGVQLALRDGLLIWTKGFGGDLMSASVPAPKDLAALAPTKRINYYIAGSDLRFERSYDCTSELVPPPYEAGIVRVVEESCSGPTGLLRYRFGFTATESVASSKQWVSNSIGYLEIVH